ncbi:DUF2271 domain-containing protein [Flavicella sp.]|uniref:DUF2271 domain-containing protein n=1 Tax=Flavicella sp. TaxID=2957742 RepID=UPI00301ABECA
MKIKNNWLYIIACLVFFVVLGFQSKEEKTAYKCMIQMANYSGEGAYVVISLIDENEEYIETLYVQGDDEKWYSDIYEWWKFQKEYKHDIDGITGATVGAGNRSINRLEISNDKFNKGYKLRFETSVENNEYFKDDVEIELTSEGVMQGKISGKGYIRYVRLIPQF